MRQLLIALVLSIAAAACGSGPLLERLLPPPRVRTDTLSDKRTAFADAYASFRRGALARALPIFEQLVTAYPELADYHLYFAGTIHQRLGQNRPAEAALARVLRDYPQSVQAPAAALELGKLMVRDDRIDQGRVWLQQALAAPDAETASAARVTLAEADERSGDLAAAYAGFMQVRRAAVGSPVARTAKQRVRALRETHPELAPTGADLLEEARLLLAEREYAAAKAAVTQIPQRRGGDVDPTDVLRVLADALYGLGETERALAVLRELVDNYPTSAAAPRALFRRASILWNRDRDSEALRAFQEFGRRYPQQARAAEALYAIGRIHQQAGRAAAAIATYRGLSTRYPRSPLAAEAQWRIGWIQYQARNWTAAAGTFAQLASRARARRRDEAAYWQGRALERAGRAAAARQVYHDVVQRNPSGYYAMWAQQRLDQVPPGLVLNHSASAVSPAPPLLESPPATDPFHFARAEELRAAGLNGLARGELAAVERAAQYDTPTLRHLLRAYQAVDGYAAALRLARRLGSRADLPPAEREHLRYPLAFWEAVRRESEVQAVDPLLVVALMRQESGFDPIARSPANAYGLMQLLPATAERVAAGGEPPIDHNDLTDAEVNIQLGTRYLRNLLTRFGGDPLKALAAYNGGETAAEKWQRRYAAFDADEFVESITYRETRDYVKRVVANYHKYQQLYGFSSR